MEKIKRAEEEKARKDKEKQARLNQKDQFMKSDNDTGVMDNLLEALKGGQYFETKPNHPRGRRVAKRNDAAIDFNRRTIQHRPAPAIPHATNELIQAS